MARSLRLEALGVSVKLELSRRPRGFVETQADNLYEGDYPTWSAAQSDAGGYDAATILERAIAATRAVSLGAAAYERDTFLFDEIQVSLPLLAALLLAGGRNGDVLSVLDFGGALGSSYRQNAGFLSHFARLNWGIVEQPSFVEAGKAEFETEQLKFFRSIKDCVLAINPNVALLSGVLQYLEDPYGSIAQLCQQPIKYIIVDRTMAHLFDRDRLVVQRVPPHIYDASYPAWLLQRGSVESAFRDAGYQIVFSFDPHPGSMFGPADLRSPYAGWLFERIDGQP